MSPDGANSVATDAAGNVYTTGWFVGTVDFDPGIGSFTLTSAFPGNNTLLCDMYLSKVDGAGNFLWAKKIGGLEEEYGIVVKADAAGNVYVGGITASTNLDADPGAAVFSLSASTNGNFIPFVLKLDANGNFVWAKQLSGDVGFIDDLLVTTAGDIFLSGTFSSTVDIDPGAGVVTFTSVGSQDAFLVKLDNGGNFIFAKQLKGQSGIASVYGASVGTDNYGNTYLTGGFSGSCDFDPGIGLSPITAPQYGSNTFILKLDAGGNFTWVKQLTGLINNGSALALDASNLYLTGSFGGLCDFDPGPSSFTINTTFTIATGNTTSTAAGNHQYVLKLDLNGNFNWVTHVPSSQSYAIALDAMSNIYTTGSFGGNVDFDPGIGIFNLQSSVENDAFVQKIDSAGDFVWARSISGVFEEDDAYSITVDNAASIYVTGNFGATADFDPGSGVANLSSAGGSDAFVLKWTQCTGATAPIDLTVPANKMICENTGANLLVSCNNPPTWFASPTGTTALGTGTNYVTPPLSIGNYTFYAGDELCSGSGRTAVTLTVSACTGIENIDNEPLAQIKVFPVPSDDGFVTVTVSDYATNSWLEVYNLQAALVMSKAVNTELTELDLSQHPAGVYLLQLKREGTTLGVQKIIR